MGVAQPGAHSAMIQRIPIAVGGQHSDSAKPLADLRSGGAAPAPRSLYLHVPFCFHKCHYCDFYSIVDSQDRQGEFTQALIMEVRALGAAARRGGEERAALDTIFVGGGTPSLLAVDHWRGLLGALDAEFDLAPIRAGGGEFTVECNPETVSKELMEMLAAGGVNRVSVGAQSFEAAHLKTLERWHDPANVQRALALADEAGIERQSIDLIFAIPGQTMDDWARDVHRALALDPGVEHVSAYSLTYEPNTAMTKRMLRGEFAPAPEDLEAEMQEYTARTLADAGLERYEVSNFARGEGARSRHNLAYWRCEPWLAAGPSASAHIVVDERTGAGHRWKNSPRLTEWMEGVQASGGFSPIVDHEPPDAARALRERIMMGVRIAEGLGESALLERAAALGAAEALMREAEKQVEKGLLETKSGRWLLTDRGFLFADGVASALMATIGG